MNENKKLSRRGFLKGLGTLAFAASPVMTALTSLSSCSVGSIREKCLTIMHTNDVHSHIDPFPIGDPLYSGLGGYARRKTLIDSYRNRLGTDRVLVFECGDMVQGTPFFNFYKGKLEMSLMNDMQVDAVTIGNHEFDNGLEGLYSCIDKAQFPFISSNYVFTDSRGSEIVKPYQVFERGGFKVGVFGLGVRLEGLVSKSNCEGVMYEDPIKTANEMAISLRNRGCNLIVALSHVGYDCSSDFNDIVIAKNTAGVDLILGGHTHTFMSHPFFVDNKEGKPVAINQVGFGGINVGVLTLRQLSSKGAVLSSAENLVVGA